MQIGNMLSIVATPLGNLSDMSYRAVEVLRDSSLIIAENPAHTHILLRHFQITGKKVIQFADHNELNVLDELIQKLSKEDGCLVSDAGTPAISDPGFRLVRACWEHNIQVSPIPGPSAAIAALSAAGLPTDKFIFAGFLPKTEPKLKTIIDEAKTIDATLIAYESPQRIVKTVERLTAYIPEARLVIARELTKMHEEFIRGSCAEVAAELITRKTIKGEITLLLSFKK